MWQGLLLILAICGVVSFGIVHLFKMAYAAYLAHTPEDDREPWYWNVELRVLAILIGATIGALFSYAGVHIVLAIGIGLAGGILNTLIVKVVKSKLKSFKFGSESSQESERGKPEDPEDGVEK